MDPQRVSTHPSAVSTQPLSEGLENTDSGRVGEEGSMRAFIGHAAYTLSNAAA